MKVGRIVVARHGGPEVLEWAEGEVGDPGPGEVRVRHTAVGVNYIDVYFRTGAYPGACPFVPGMEGAGIVEAVGAGVTELREGDRVAYGAAPMGAYAEARTLPADRLVKIPEGVDDETAAAAMLKGMTAEYLVRRTVAVRPGDTVLVHAAAGGVGLLLCQWAKHLGATVIGTVGSEEKARLAAENGCDHPVRYDREPFADQVRAITSGRGVRVVYDSVGKDTFDGSLGCLAPRGTLALFGQSSGKVPPLDPQILNWKGSVFLTRPSLGHHVATARDLRESAEALFAVIRSGAVRVTIGQRFPLREAARAHAALEARRTVGSTVLVP